MARTNVQFKWTDIDKVSFKDIKTTIAHAPSLRSPYFENDFIIYTFSLDNSLARMLIQKEELGDEYPISFMSTGLQGDELNYPAVGKQAYAVFKVVKQFMPYILKNRKNIIVPRLTVQSLFVRKELGDRTTRI